MKTRKNKKGISLIVLVITIIVMIILATAIIISISNSGIVNRANEAVKETNEAQLKQLVTLAWSEAFLKETTETKDDAYYLKEVTDYLKANGVTDAELEKYVITANTQGATITTKTNEYGFYFDEMYSGENTNSDGTTTRLGFVFHEDGSLEMYSEISGVMACMQALPSGSVTYTKEQIAMGETVGTVSENGLVISADGTSVRCTFEEITPVHYGYIYTMTNGTTTTKAAINNSNKLVIITATQGMEETEETIDAVVSGDGHYITNSESVRVASISHDGRYMLIEGKGMLELTEEKLVRHNGTIPEGATYYVGVTATALGDYTGATSTYTEGDSFPEVVSAGDVYVYGDYEYRYNMGYMLLAWNSTENADFGDMGYPGWGIMRLDNKKTSYEPVIANINNEDVTVMLFTYAGCGSMTESPIIPNTIQCMWSTYYNCKGLTVTPVLPNGVGYFNQTFYGCTALTTAPTIPASAEVLKSIFWKCTNLKTYVGSQEADGYFLNYVIPSKVTSISCMFEECTSVISMPDLSKATSLTDMSAAFRGCTALTNTTTIPNTVKDMNATFHKCTSLVTAPTIPTGVEDLEFAFGDCTNLTGNVRVDAALTDDMAYLTCFTGTVKPIKIIGSCPTIVKQDWAGLYDNVTY